MYNAAAVLDGGDIVASYRKVHLPNYGVFDELRYFQHGPGPATIAVDGHRIGLTVCEDIWQPADPLEREALSGARLILNLSASPYDLGKGDRRERMLVTRARDHRIGEPICGCVHVAEDRGIGHEAADRGRAVRVERLARAAAREQQLRHQVVGREIGIARVRRQRAPAPRLAEDRTLDVEDGVHARRLRAKHAPSQ